MEALAREQFLVDGKLRGRPLPRYTPFRDENGKLVP